MNVFNNYFQFELCFHSMPYPSIFCMFIPQQSNTRSVELLIKQIRMVGFYMRGLKSPKIMDTSTSRPQIRSLLRVSMPINQSRALPKIFQMEFIIGLRKTVLKENPLLIFDSEKTFSRILCFMRIWSGRRIKSSTLSVKKHRSAIVENSDPAEAPIQTTLQITASVAHRNTKQSPHHQ